MPGGAGPFRRVHEAVVPARPHPPPGDTSPQHNQPPHSLACAGAPHPQGLSGPRGLLFPLLLSRLFHWGWGWGVAELDFVV